MAIASDIRLPGVYFIPPPKVAPSGLAPLDVAGFVGFAERGPIDVPVRVDDFTVYSAVFGGDLPLARGEDGRTVYAYLPSAVGGFFANGGRRCWVVRVAGERATRSRFTLPGVVALDQGSGARLATVQASSEGSWSARLRLGARLDSTPLPLSAFRQINSQRIEWNTVGAPSAIQPGDVLRLSYDAQGEWLFPVRAIETSLSTTRVSRVVLIGQEAWRVVLPAEIISPVAIDRVQTLTADGARGLGSPPPSGELSANGERFALQLFGASLGAVNRGDVLRLRDPGGANYLLRVAEVRAATDLASPTLPAVLCLGDELIAAESGTLPVAPPPGLTRVERLRFDLHVREGEQRRPTIVDLAFNSKHSRFWGSVILLESSSLYRQSPIDTGDVAARAAEMFKQLSVEGRAEQNGGGEIAAVTLAGLLAPPDDNASLTYLPLGLPAILTETNLFGAAEGETGRDDLESFESRVFLDGYLVPNPAVQSVRGSSLLEEAFNRAFVQNKRLKGLHSLFFIEEVALVAVPDSAHRGWTAQPVESPPRSIVTSPPIVETKLEEVDPSRFIECVAPVVEKIEPASGPLAGSTLVEVTGSGFVRALSTSVSFDGLPASNIDVISSTLLRCLTPKGTRAGAVTVEVITRRGAGSKSGAFTYVDVPVETLPRPMLVEDFALSSLLEIQHALFNFCQARADAVAILALPLHFEKRQCIEWIQAFRERLGLPKRGNSFDGVRDVADLSYAAVYHPWILLSDLSAPDRVRAVPADGAICGSIAARERERQVWVAPANLPLQGVVGLLPAISTDDWANLFDLQFNIIRQGARDFRAMSARTLSDQSDLLQLSVRRLMILLRKAATSLGMDYVFRPNNEHLRQAVSMAFERLLRFMFERGAFAGATAAESYRVTTDSTVNTRESLDQGRFIAKIQVAPSEPMEFITVLLTRTGENLLRATEV